MNRLSGCRHAKPDVFAFSMTGCRSPRTLCSGGITGEGFHCGGSDTEQVSAEDKGTGEIACDRQHCMGPLLTQEDTHPFLVKGAFDERGAPQGTGGTVP